MYVCHLPIIVMIVGINFVFERNLVFVTQTSNQRREILRCLLCMHVCMYVCMRIDV